MDQNFRLDQMKEVAAAVWAEGKDTPIWAFYAPMGTGKTTLIHAICEALGVTDAVSSPTFALVNEYQHQGGSIFHMDWYRLGSLEPDGLWSVAGLWSPMQREACDGSGSLNKVL